MTPNICHKPYINYVTLKKTHEIIMNVLWRLNVGTIQIKCYQPLTLKNLWAQVKLTPEFIFQLELSALKSQLTKLKLGVLYPLNYESKVSII